MTKAILTMTVSIELHFSAIHRFGMAGKTSIFWAGMNWLSMQSGPPEYWPLEWAWPCGAMKMPNTVMKVQPQSKVHLGRKVTSSKLGASKALEHPLKSTLPLVISKHNINSCVRCIGWLYICFTFERFSMSSINKRFTRLVVTFKKATTQAQGTLDNNKY